MSPVVGTLWIVATPIGSLEDLAPRARRVLAEVDLIVAEDTRRTRRLLSHAEIAAGRRLQSLHEHNENERVPKVLAALAEGRSVALVSDAGTPVLSDPGFVLVREARLRSVPVCSVPGASAFTAALAAAGQPPLPATLVGFLPPRRGARRRRIEALGALRTTLVILLSPHRLRSELVDLAEVLGADRPATLLAEMSKKHERGLVASLGELGSSDEADKPRGEYVVVVAPPSRAPPSLPSRSEVEAAYRQAIASGCDRRAALREVAAGFGLTRRQVYDMLLGTKADPEERE